MDESQQTTVSSYERPLFPFFFDLLISTIFLPFGGIRRIRSEALDRLNVGPGVRVLELGCGTGGLTTLMVARGAQVTAIDGSSRMLVRARRRAPEATFARQQLEALDVDATFDLVLFAFVLHELPPELRSRALLTARRVINEKGMIAILDHSVPQTGLLARAWRAFLMRLEPPTVAACIEEGYNRELEASGLSVLTRHELARGTAALIVASTGTK